MSAFSAWSYTAIATFWAPVLDAFGQPSSWTRHSYRCSFRSGGRQSVDSEGEEFAPDYTIWLEALPEDAPRPGWFVYLGESCASAPPADAQKVRRVRRHDDSTFGASAMPDYEVMT